MKNLISGTFYLFIQAAIFLTVSSFADGEEQFARPNVLFLFTDDQQHDTIQALGNKQIKTPNLDRLVKNGVSFTNTYIMGGTSMAVCTPSRAALFSGRTLWNLESQGPWDFAISKRSTTLAEHYRNNGYTTFATGKNDPGFGKNDHFMRSFSEGANLYYRGGHRGQNRTPLFRYPVAGDYSKREKIPASGRFNADLFADACVEFLKKRKGVEDPFFAYVSFMTPHDPLNCPQEYLDMYKPGDITLPDNYLPEHPFDSGIHHIRDEKLLKRPLKELVIKEELAKYYALVTHTDAQIGRILDALEASGHADNTIIVFSSDNGLALGRHGLTGKQNVYEHSIRVPLILNGPGIPKGERRDQLCYLYDIYPTLCDLSALKTPGTVEFKTLKNVINNPKAGHRDHIYAAFMSWQRSVRNEKYKLIEYCVNDKRHTQLFDLSTDPHEMNNLFEDTDHKDELVRLRKLLVKERVRLNDGNTPYPFTDKLGKEFWASYEKNITP